MTTVLQVGTQTIPVEEIIPLLTRYQMLPQLLREIVIDQAIASIDCTSEETAKACQQFYEQHQLSSETARQTWRSQQGVTSEQLETLATRQLRIEKFKQATFGNKVESCFLTRKGQLDKVICSLIRTKDVAVAQELYFRIQEGEQTFAELAREYSEGREAQTGGLNGPVELGVLHPILARMLAMSQPNQLWPPTRIDEWVIIVRLEKFIPAQLDEPMRQRMLNELFASWLAEQQKAVSVQSSASENR